MIDGGGIADWYATWIDHHRIAFLLPDGWVEAALTWWPTFAALRATGAELAAATAEVQGSDSPPRFPGDHLPAVKAALGRVRDRKAAIQRRAEEGDPDGYSVCVECSNTGWVIVPHPKHVRDGIWVPTHHNRGEPVFLTASVSCRCYRGRKAFDGLMAREKRPLSIDNYAAMNPHWREQIAERDQAASELFEATRSAATWSPAALTKDLATRMSHRH